MSYNPLLIANKIIELKENKLTIMELLKLQYIAHGYSLAILDKPLFNGKVEAWPYGPVIREVYNAFRGKGIIITSPVKITDADQTISPECETILQTTINGYKDKSGWDLSALTHETDSPWTQTVAAKGFYREIPNDLTKAYYTNLIS